LYNVYNASITQSANCLEFIRHDSVYNVHTICTLLLQNPVCLFSPSYNQMQYLIIFSILHDNILWLKIAVDNTTRMEVLDCCRYVMCHMSNLILRQTTTILWSKQNLVILYKQHMVLLMVINNKMSVIL